MIGTYGFHHWSKEHFKAEIGYELAPEHCELQKRHRQLEQENIRVTSIYDEPGETRYFDLWATTEGIRLTLQEDVSLESDEILPSWVRVGVSHLEEAVEWYQKYMGMELVRDVNSTHRYALMKLKLHHREAASVFLYAA
ncbi:VOC family protein [Paenibacillus amylolyticus]|uniref:VOC family protein n=1 Tax=Paenibacillus amylolyticus TaxID=1451 RepID=UPI003EB994D5